MGLEELLIVQAKQGGRDIEGMRKLNTKMTTEHIHDMVGKLWILTLIGPIQLKCLQGKL